MCKRSVLCHCPVKAAHKGGDVNPSLSVSLSGDKVLFHCHAGCAQTEVMAGLREMGLWGGTPRRNTGWQLVTTYEYRNAAGELVAEHGRFNTETGKAFAWRLPDNSWKNGLGTVGIKSLPLYRLHDALSDTTATVWFTEGEKAADTCHSHGLAAVCLGGGSNQQAFGNALDPLRDRRVILWPDNDDHGRTYMARIAELLPQATFVRPIVPPKGDAYEYFTGGGTVEGLHALLESALVGKTSKPWLSQYEGQF